MAAEALTGYLFSPRHRRHLRSPVKARQQSRMDLGTRVKSLGFRLTGKGSHFWIGVWVHGYRFTGIEAHG